MFSPYETPGTAADNCCRFCAYRSQKCGCGSNNEEGQTFPYAIEFKRSGMVLFEVICGDCGSYSLSNTMKDAISDWNAGDVVCLE